MYLDQIVEEIAKRPCIGSLPKELISSIVVNVIDLLDANGIIGVETRIEDV